MNKAVPSRTIWRRPLKVRQPQSVAVLSTGGRLHPSFLRREGLVRMWSSPCRRDGEVEKTPFLRSKKGSCPLRGEPKGSQRLLKVGFRTTLCHNKYKKYEGNSISRWQRYSLVPHYKGYQQAADSNLRQTDDILPNISIDVGRYP